MDDDFTKPSSLYIIMSFFVVAGTVKPFPVSLVELVDYLLGKTIYDISEKTFGLVYKTAKKMSIAMKQAYDCDGISMRQHNEPAGGQSQWHFHVHIFPRY